MHTLPPRDNFFGYEFHSFDISDKDAIDKILRTEPQTLAEYTFACLAAWQWAHDHSYSIVHDNLLLLQMKIDGKSHLLQPMGTFSSSDQELLLQRIKSSDYPIKIARVSDSFLLRYPEFCKNFHAMPEHNLANYLYRAEDLASLASGHFEKKRNLIAQAKHMYEWEAQEMSAASLAECLNIFEASAESRASSGGEVVSKELVALKYSLDNFDALNLSGLFIYSVGKPVAFSIFESLNSNTAVVHFEKAVRSYKGLYQVINQETAKVLAQRGFTYINREEDLGIPGLRHAKISYFPVAILSSYSLSLI